MQVIFKWVIHESSVLKLIPTGTTTRGSLHLHNHIMAKTTVKLVTNDMSGNGTFNTSQPFGYD